MERVDAVVPGDALGPRPGGGARAPAAVRHGQPRRQRARPGRAGVRRAPDGRGPPRALHGHVRRRALARGRLRHRRRRRRRVLRDGEARATTSTARLEANEWRGAVEPRLVVRSLHPLEAATSRAAAAAVHVPQRRRRLVGRGLGRLRAPPSRRPRRARERRAERTVVDRRGEGALGVLGDLLTTGEPLLVVCADVSRRRALLERDLAAGALRARAVGAAVGALRPARLERARRRRPRPCCATTARSTRDPALLSRFTHVFALDPPPSAETSGSLRRSGGGERRVPAPRLGRGRGRVRARGPRARAWRCGPHLDRDLPGAGGARARRAPRCPRGAARGRGPPSAHARLAGRCLRVLAELDLARFERSSGTVRCTITNGEAGRAGALQTFRACAAAAKRGSDS